MSNVRLSQTYLRELDFYDAKKSSIEVDPARAFLKFPMCSIFSIVIRASEQVCITLLL